MSSDAEDAVDAVAGPDVSQVVGRGGRMRDDRRLADGGGETARVAVLMVLARVVAAAHLFGCLVPHDSVNGVGCKNLKTEKLI